MLQKLLGLFIKKHLGNFGTCGILSFNGNKVVTTGNGGALITNDKKILKKQIICHKFQN